MFAAKNVGLFSEESLGTNCKTDVTKKQLIALGPYLTDNLMLVRKLSLQGLLSRTHIISHLSFVRFFPHLKALLPTGKGLGNKDIEPLGTALKTNTTLTELDLSSLLWFI